MRWLFRIATILWLLVSLILFLLPVIFLPMKSGKSWHLFVYEGLETPAETIWLNLPVTGAVPVWIVVLYWLAVFAALVAAWRPGRR